MSLPLLFKLTAIFLFGWALLFAVVYPIFCKKYEQKLIQQKENEMNNVMATGQCETKAESTMQYWSGQITGMSRL